MGSKSYVCDKPPCIHVVVDWRRKVFAVFFEDSLGNIVQIPSSRLVDACRKVEELLKKRVREATGDLIDELAEEFLGAELIEECEE
ncbi:MAG: hypothetical protein J7J20_04130 [Desulfurococcales archaeon]|nr:hypothetical protein [Desulfurococcales archaeon]